MMTLSKYLEKKDLCIIPINKLNSLLKIQKKHESNMSTIIDDKEDCIHIEGRGEVLLINKYIYPKIKTGKCIEYKKKHFKVIGIDKSRNNPVMGCILREIV